MLAFTIVTSLIASFSATFTRGNFTQFLIGQNSPSIRTLHRYSPIHETFQCSLSLLTRSLGNFPEDHSTHNCSKLSMFNCEILK
ncbi:hypothetical protein JHK86_006945 [Glycine max]|nr:hypothetical protein JHK86_006945 [Glycine max]